MVRITTSHELRFRKIPRIETVAFSYSGDAFDYEVEAEVEIEGNSYVCIGHNLGDHFSPGSHHDRVICEKAESLVMDKFDPEPANKRTGCQCIGEGDGVLTRAMHDEFCVLRLSAAERRAFDELVAKERKTTR